MNTQHTPGPWAVQFEGEHSPAASGVYSKGKATGRICTVPPMHEDRDANARLIAAAPDLLDIAKAYRNLLRTMAHSEGDLATFAHIESVINNVEGVTA